jgi:curli biogenesis system outer membrane secretion channel CsgG
MKLHWNSFAVALLRLCLALLYPADVQAQEPKAAVPVAGSNWQGPKLRVMVMDMNSSGLLKNPPAATSVTPPSILPPTELARGMTEMLTTALVKSNRFVVLERSGPGVTQPDPAAIPRTDSGAAGQNAKTIGAQAFITGDITEFSYSQQGLTGTLAGLRGLGSKLGKAKVSAKVGIDLRIVDADTGQVLAAQHAEGKATMSNVSADMFKGRQDFNATVQRDTPLGEATRQALDRAVSAIEASMKNVPWLARVIDVREGKVYINAGAEAGVQAGVEIDVFHPGEKLVDPETGQPLGDPESRIGSVKIETVQSKYSVANIVSGSGMQRGDVVRLKLLP